LGETSRGDAAAQDDAKADDAETAATLPDMHKKMETCGSPGGRGIFHPWVITLVGILLVGASLALYHSGWETPDYLYQDDKCYSSEVIMIQGLPIDACLTREEVDKGTDCGGPAADLFCKNLGANYMVNFTLADVTVKRGAITLGNKFLGGQLGFEQICCDEGKYEPHTSRWLLLAGGTLLLYVAALLAAKAVLYLCEVTLVLVIDAGEALYFFLDIEKAIKWLLYSSWLVSWVNFTLWHVWCYQGIDCEDHGSELRGSFYRAAQAMLFFSIAYFVSKAAPRVICARYLYKGQFGKIKDMMRKEMLLAALIRPEVAHVVRSASGRAGSPLPPPPSAAETEGDGIAELHLGHVGAIRGFQRFLRKYQDADKDELVAEAEMEGNILFENLASYDLNRDGTVGIHDFLQIFRQVPVKGFTAPEAARLAWAMFDLNADNKLSREEVVAGLEQIYMERVNTALTVLSTESAVRSLETAIGFVLYTLLIFVVMALFDMATSFGSSSLDFFTTYVLALSFIFGDTVKSIFRSAIFLFAEQPFSVGDYLSIDGTLWLVDSFDLIYTVLYKWEENQMCKMPNDQLIDSQLINVSRGRSFKDTMVAVVPLTMSIQEIQGVKDKMNEAAATRPKEYLPGTPHVKINSIDSGQTMQVQFEWIYAFPPGDRGRVDEGRDFMVAVVKEALLQLGTNKHTLNLSFNLVKGGTTTN